MAYKRNLAEPVRAPFRRGSVAVAGVVAFALASGCHVVTEPRDQGREVVDRDGDRGETDRDRGAAGGAAYVTAGEIEQEFVGTQDYLVDTDGRCGYGRSPYPSGEFKIARMQQEPRGEDDEAEFMIYSDQDTEWMSEFYELRKLSAAEVEPGMEILFHREHRDRDSLPETLYEPAQTLHEVRNGKFCGTVVTDTGWLDQGAVRVAFRDRFVDENNIFVVVEVD